MLEQYYIYNTKAYCIFFLQTKSTAYLQAPAAKYAAFKVCSLINILTCLIQSICSLFGIKDLITLIDVIFIIKLCLLSL